MTIVIDEPDVTVLIGKAHEQLATLADGSAQCIVTSPPYFGLRDYRVDGQLGLERTPAEYVTNLVDALAQAKRVLADDGVMWLNLGDCYAGNGGAAGRFAATGLEGTHPRSRPEADDAHIFGKWNRDYGVANKNLVGIPWRVAFALQDDGWILRNDTIWHKPNAMPESVTDRLSSRHEYLFLLTKQQRYYFDLDAIKIPTTGMKAGNSTAALVAYGEGSGVGRDRRFGGNPHSTLLDVHTTRNPGDVWSITTKPFPGAHFAVMPYDLVRPCILAGSPEGGVVLDPFAGSGTTLMVARTLGRRSIGIELNPDYIELIRDRIGAPTLDFTTEVTA